MIKYLWTGEYRPPKRWEWYFEIVMGCDTSIERVQYNNEEIPRLSGPTQVKRNLFDSRWILRRRETYKEAQ